MALLDRAIVTVLPAVPRPIVRRISSRYIAGTTLEDACRVVRELNAEGKTATVDVLGEEIANADETAAITRTYIEALQWFEREGLQANVSVKPTGLGLGLGYAVCKRSVLEIVAAAERVNRFVRIDMEDSSTTDATLRMYRELREIGHERIGIVLQARLRRTLDDIAELADLNPNIRLCKGIYLEPEEIAYTDYEEIRAAFVRALERLFRVGSFVGVATHDTFLIDHAKRLIQEHRRGREQYEFQMLLGVRGELADGLVREGHRMRVYVPFGVHWYEYSLRRLQENPKIAGYVAADTLGRFLPRRNGS